jgi:hypothetical protein
MTTPRPATIGDFVRPRQQVATREYINQVRKDLNLDRETGEKIADYIGAEIERVGGSDARLVMIVDEDDVGGPFCSWCWAVAGLCPHIAGGASEHVAAGTEGTPA